MTLAVAHVCHTTSVPWLHNSVATHTFCKRQVRHRSASIHGFVVTAWPAVLAQLDLSAAMHTNHSLSNPMSVKTALRGSTLVQKTHRPQDVRGFCLQCGCTKGLPKH